MSRRSASRLGGAVQEETKRQRVDIIVRGYHGDRGILLLTLNSIAVPGPFAHGTSPQVYEYPYGQR